MKKAGLDPAFFMIGPFIGPERDQSTRRKPFA
jgi:hypothetical protein